MTLRESKIHKLENTPDSVSVGIIDPDRVAALSIDPGDEVELSTLGHWAGEITASTTIQDLPSIRNQFPGALGPHTLTGPIAVRGARPGDALIVDILDLVPGTHGFNIVVAQPHGRGLLRERFPHGRITHFELDPITMTTRFINPKSGRSIRIALSPFLGIMGVAPGGDGLRSSVEPGPFGGNMDLSELIVGSRLRLPIFRNGAGFYCGDGHGVQGDGEVNQTAIETSMDRVHLRLDIERDAGLVTPRVEAGSRLISVGFGSSLETAARAAVDDLVNWLSGFGFAEEDAYIYCSLMANVRVTQVVNRTVGVHAIVERPVWEKGLAHDE